MKILAVSDEVVDWIYSPQVQTRCADVGLVIGCGDLPIYYLEYIASALDAPCFFVRGNHDLHEVGKGGVIKSEPEGWINLDRQVQNVGGVTMAGLEGCLRYKPDARFQYTQGEQSARAVFLAGKLMTKSLSGSFRLDVFVSHAPPFGIHNGPDHAHTGFTSFNWLISQFKPRLWLHGHQHRNYAPREAAETQSGATRVVNVHPYRILEI